MLTVNQISKSFGMDIILKAISFNLNRGERLGLVGPNGCGKTTLLRILANLDKPDSGGFHYDPPDLHVGYLPQGLEPIPGETIEGFVRRMEGDLPAVSKQLEQLASELAKNPGSVTLHRQYDDVLKRMEVLAVNTGRGPAVLAGLGLEKIPQDMLVSRLSGGQKTRLALAGVLLSSPQLLLLDEPTNHLDLDMLEWLEDWLVSPPGGSMRGAIIVSHDRAFLDRIASGILELDLQTHTLRPYAGNYTDYLERKLAERERQWQAYSDQQEEIMRLRAAIARVRKSASFRRGGKADSGDKFAAGFFSDQSKGTMGRAKHLEKRLDRLITEDKVEKPTLSWQMKLDFEGTPTSGRDVLLMEDLSVGYGENVLLKGITQNIRYGSRVALIGPNGSGKTTLLRTILGQVEPLEGRVRLGASVRPGYMGQEQEDLNPQEDAFTAVRRLAPLSETDTRSFLHKFLFSGDDVFLKIGNLSFGERARLSLACLVAQGCNFLLLDEPINHLDIPSRTRFEQALAVYEGTVLAVVHDRYFIEGFASEIWEVKDCGLQITGR